MDKPVMFLAHDPLSNTEMQVSEFDPALLNAAAGQGVVFIAVDANGFREIVRPEDVTPPDGVSGSFTLVEPVYVHGRCY
jgi:TRAP-type C4-dicarboxylate transport system substrate-binding protein